MGIFDGLYSILLAANPKVIYLCYTGKLSASMEQRVRGMHEGSIRLALDPLSVLGAMGQSITDTFDEEGLSYAAGYITADIAISIVLDKGISKAFGKVDDIAEVGIKAANKVDDAAEIGAKAAGKVDDVAEVGAKAAGKIDDVAGSSTKLGNSFAEMMSPEDAAKYQKFLEKGSTSGLKPEELQGITKADAYQALNKVNYDEVLKLRKAGNTGGTNSVDFSLIKNEYAGEEWCRYFKDAYGSDNVIWENATPSQLARSYQGTGKYLGVDNYIDITVNKGTILYRGEPNGTEYFTIVDAIEQSGRDATTLFEGLQVEKNPIHGYRGEMQGYLFNENIASAYGIANANPQFGKGKLPQYYIPNVQELIDKEILVSVDKIKLYK